MSFCSVLNLASSQGGQVVQKRSCHETQELFIRCQIRDYGSRLFGAVGQVGLDPTLPDGITLVLQEAKDVIALGID